MNVFLEEALQETLEIEIIMRYKDDIHPYSSRKILETPDIFAACALYNMLVSLSSMLSPAKAKAEINVMKERAKRHHHDNSPCFIEKRLPDGKIQWTCREVE